MRRPVVLTIACLLAPCLALAKAPGRAGSPGERWDVSYLVDADLAKVLKHKKAVGNALGPRLQSRLRVARAVGGYALLYLRHGDAQAVRTTAAAHSKILRPRGLGEALCVPSQPWAEVPAASRLPSPSLAPAPVTAAAAAPAPTPGPTAADTPEAQDANERSQLEAAIDGYIKESRRLGRISPDERTAWSVYDFTTGETLVEINADLKLQAASLIKPFVALAFMDQVNEGKLAYDKHSQAQLARMIQRSDNAATNWTMRQLGGPAAAQRMLKSRYGDMLRTVEIVEYIPRGGKTYRNRASARDYSRFLLALWKDELPGSAEIKRLMALPKHDRLTTRTTLPEDTEVYSKTGSTRQLCGDMGVLLAKGPDGREYPYTVVGIIEKSRPARNYMRWLRSRGNIIRGISGLVFQRIVSMHGSPAQ